MRTGGRIGGEARNEVVLFAPLSSVGLVKLINLLIWHLFIIHSFILFVGWEPSTEHTVLLEQNWKSGSHRSLGMKTIITR